MALQGTGPRLFRLQALLREYLNAEVDAIDTAATTHAEIYADNFETPNLLPKDIQVFRDDREGECVTVVIIPTGARRPHGLDKHGPGANQSRYDTDHAFELYVTAKSNTGTWGEHGAWLRADRVAHGVTACLLKYSTLAIAAQSLTGLALWSEIDDWERLPTEEKDDTMAVTLVASLTVRTMERIA